MRGRRRATSASAVGVKLSKSAKAAVETTAPTDLDCQLGRLRILNFGRRNLGASTASKQNARNSLSFGLYGPSGASASQTIAVHELTESIESQESRAFQCQIFEQRTGQD